MNKTTLIVYNQPVMVKGVTIANFGVYTESSTISISLVQGLSVKVMLHDCVLVLYNTVHNIVWRVIFVGG